MVTLRVRALPLLVAVAFAGSVPQCRAAEKIALEISKIFFEYNSSAGDLGVQVFLDGEDWKKLKIVNPKDRVIFAGKRDDVCRVISTCTIVVVPSRAEALGRTILEAWAVRRPVIGSDIEGIREIITQSGGGLMFKSESADDLAARIAELLDDSSKRDALAARGQQWLADNCDPARYADRFVEFILQCLGQNNPTPAMAAQSRTATALPSCNAQT